MPAAVDRLLRPQLDRAISRALVDPPFAQRLLANPVLAVADSGCSPQHQLELRQVRARTLRELASRLESLFWPPVQPLQRNGHLQATGDAPAQDRLASPSRT